MAERCEECKGSGHTEPFGMWNEVQPCWICKGRGVPPLVQGKNEVRCACCEGTGICGGEDPEPCELCEEMGFLPSSPVVDRLNEHLRYTIRLYREAAGLPKWETA